MHQRRMTQEEVNALFARRNLIQMVQKIFVDKFGLPYERLPPNVRDVITTKEKTNEERLRCWDNRKHLDIFFEDERLWCVVLNVMLWKESMINDYQFNY